MSEVTLQEAVKRFAKDLAAKVDTFIADVSELEVYTFTTPPDQATTLFKSQADMANLSIEAKAGLRAYTKVSFDGDMAAWVPTDASGEVNKSLWDVHQTVVKQAVENRAAMIRTIGDAAASALKALGIAGG
jgi:hypothetical protein